jgi:quaternary ammonium compound-resistance protein SugE
MHWWILLVAGIFEVISAVCFKYTVGFTKLWPSVFAILTAIVSVYLLAQAMRTLPMGTGYAVWTGIGGAGTAVVGIFLFGESAALARMIFIGLIVAGIVGLKFSSGH